MPVETLEDVIEDLADKFGVYGCGPENDHPEDCRCRICFGIYWKDRILRAVEVDRKLAHHSG